MIDLDALEKDVEAVRYITVGEPNNVELTVAEFYALTAELRACRKVVEAARALMADHEYQDDGSDLARALVELEAVK